MSTWVIPAAEVMLVDEVMLAAEVVAASTWVIPAAEVMLGYRPIMFTVNNWGLALKCWGMVGCGIWER